MNPIHQRREDSFTFADRADAYLIFARTGRAAVQN